MRVGILYICTGKYDRFFEAFYNSCEKNFLPETKKTYYVWTDSNLEIFENPNVVRIQQSKIGWPYDTMLRFKMFHDQRRKLSENNYLFFLNANMIVVDQVGEEILPQEENDYLVGVQHPGFYNQSCIHFPYERNDESEFCMAYGEGRQYFQGCFNGGEAGEFLKMSETLNYKIEKDLSSDIIPIWHDESALNWYYDKRNPLVLDSGYAYPENWNIPFDKKIIQLDKAALGGHNELRS